MVFMEAASRTRVSMAGAENGLESRSLVRVGAQGWGGVAVAQQESATSVCSEDTGGQFHVIA